MLAATLRAEDATFRPVQKATRLRVAGCDLVRAGDFTGAPVHQTIVFLDPGRGIYKRLMIKGCRLIGAVMHGDTAMRDALIFGPGFAIWVPANPMAIVAALPPAAEICGCTGLCMGKIEKAIRAGDATLDQVRAITKASSSCGTSTGLVQQIMAVTPGQDFAQPTATPMCKCTDHIREGARRAIKAMA